MMAQKSAFVKSDDTTLDRILHTVEDVGNVLTQVDQAINPGDYQPYQPQPQPQPQHQAGFAWGKWLLVAGVVGTGAYAAKKHFENEDSKKK